MDFGDAIRRESELFHRTASGAEPTRPVASCPGWAVADLVCKFGIRWMFNCYKPAS